MAMNFRQIDDGLKSSLRANGLKPNGVQDAVEAVSGSKFKPASKGLLRDTAADIKYSDLANTMRSIGTNKIAADAAIGAGVGIGGNAINNGYNGSSGGYIGAAAGGALLGGSARTLIQHGGLEERLGRFATGIKDKSTTTFTKSEKSASSNFGSEVLKGKGGKEASLSGYSDYIGGLNTQAAEALAAGDHAKHAELTRQIGGYTNRMNEVKTNFGNSIHQQYSMQAEASGSRNPGYDAAEKMFFNPEHKDLLQQSNPNMYKKILNDTRKRQSLVNP